MTDTISAQDARRELIGTGEITFRAYHAGSDASWRQMSNTGREQWERAEKAIIAALRAEPARGAEEMEPSPGLLMSMALRYDHGLGMPGYYDQQIFSLSGAASHAQRLESALSTMRQLWEEVTGHGFYRPEKEAEYAARLARLRGRPLPQGSEGGGV